MKRSWLKILACTLLIPFFFIIYKLYITRAAAFGCFDDCFNYGAGFFITKGKLLYRDVFFNHQPSMAYLSAAIQTITDPINIYELLVKHRQFLLLWNFIWAAVFVFQFGLSGFLFPFLYEGTKFYIFGDRFLAEGMIVYPFVYATGVMITFLQKKKVSIFQFVLSYLCIVFIFFSREPYIIALGIPVLVLGNYLWKERKWKTIALSITIFGIPLLQFPFNSYWYNLVTVNAQTVLAHSLSESNLLGFGILQAFFYPISIAITPSRTFFHQILLLVDLLFLISTGILISRKKFWKILGISLILLGTANLRPVPVGQMYYASFHLLPWYGIFLFVTISFSRIIFSFHPKAGFLLICGFILTICFSLFSKEAFFYENVDPQTELITNYGEEIKIGNTIHHLSAPTDSLFLDGWGELIFWQADRVSPYRYSWYTSVMPLIPLFADEKTRMFEIDPPDFYYGTCPNEATQSRMMPDFAKTLYTQLLSEGKHSCVWVKNTKLSEITDEQWKRAGEFLFEKPVQ